VDHGESTRLQYGLAERAVALGWAPGLVRVIDEDLGRSAAGAEDRPGFQRPVTEVTMGQVGLVLGMEMSRPTRAGRDWHQLIELCSLSRRSWPTPTASTIPMSTTTGCCWAYLPQLTAVVNVINGPSRGGPPATHVPSRTGQLAALITDSMRCRVRGRDRRLLHVCSYVVVRPGSGRYSLAPVSWVCGVSPQVLS
jgi:Resolvase, N terminal domain